MPAGQPADHEQAHPPGGGQVDRTGLGQPGVRLGDLGLVHPDALVEDVDVERAVVGQPGRHGHARFGRGERGRVVQQLGDQAHQVARGVPDDPRRGRRLHLDPLVLLDFRDRGAQHVGGADRPAGPAPRLGTGQHHQVLVVAAHAGREVVELEERGQLVGVLLVPLELLDQLQLTLHQALAAARQIDEHAGVTGAHGGLLGGQPQCLVVHLVEGAGDLADLVVALDRHRLDVGALRAALLDVAHGVRQLFLGDVQRAGPQDLQRPQQLAGDQEDDRHGQDHRAEQQHGQQPRPARGVVDQLCRLRRSGGAEPAGHLADLGSHRGRGGGPVPGGQPAERLAVRVGQHRFDHPVAVLCVGTVHRDVEVAALRLGGRGAEVGQPVGQPELRGAQGGQFARGQPGARGAVGHQCLADGYLLTGDGQGVQGARGTAERAVAGAGGGRGAEVEQRAGHGGVLVDRRHRVELPAVGRLAQHGQPARLLDGGPAGGGERGLRLDRAALRRSERCDRAVGRGTAAVSSGVPPTVPAVSTAEVTVRSCCTAPVSARSCPPSAIRRSTRW